jgi:hypothetical protein
MTRREYAHTRTLAARMRPVLTALAVAGTCIAAALAGNLV